MIGRQITQGLLGAENDMVAVSNIVANSIFRARLGRNTAFADDFHTVTQVRGAFKRFAKRGFTLIIAVDIGVVDGRNPQIQVLLNKANQSVGGHLPVHETPVAHYKT